MAKVLVAEDDVDLSTIVTFNLRKHGFDVVTATTGARALKVVRTEPLSCVVLDLMLPDISGLEVCQEIRGDSLLCELPVIMVTARGSEQDRLLGLETGADDYIVKPFSVRELVLRVKAVLRRAPTPRPDVSVVEAGGIAVDTAAHRVFAHAKEVSLTHTEYQLLTIFMGKPGRVFSRRQLLDQVWNIQGNVETRTVDTHIKRLREKLGDAGACIETVRSVGYRFVDGKQAD
jgi:two-component system phosphate regulon response regulator PhoB